MTRRHRWLLLCCILGLGALTGCASTPSAVPELPRAEQVDLPRFMGDWYVIAQIPTYPERRAHNSVESYRLEDDGSVDTTFRFRRGSFEARERTMNPRGFPDAESGNAEWGMRFVWPFKAEFIIAWVDDDYRSTIIARSKRDYVWLMHRQPRMSPAELGAAVQRIGAMGYDLDALVFVPQRW